MIETDDRDTLTPDLQYVVSILRRALRLWTNGVLGQLITVDCVEVPRGMDIGIIGDVVLRLDDDLEDLSLKIDTVSLLMKVISRDSG